MQSASCVYNILQNQHIIKTKTVVLEKPQKRKLSVCPMLDPSIPLYLPPLSIGQLKKGCSVYLCLYVNLHECMRMHLREGLHTYACIQGPEGQLSSPAALCLSLGGMVSLGLGFSELGWKPSCLSSPASGSLNTKERRDRHLKGCLMCFLCGCGDPNSGLHGCAISPPSCWAISLTLSFFFSFLKSSYNSLLSWVEVRIFWMHPA